VGFDLTAFLDESKKPVRDLATGRLSGAGDHYVVAGAIIIEGEILAIRRDVAEIEERFGYRLHYADLRSRQRRLDAIAALNEIPGWDAYLFETARPLLPQHHSEHHIRAKVLTAAFTHLANEVGISHTVLETRSHPRRGFTLLDQKDRQVLQKLHAQRTVPSDFRIAHADKTEKLLAIADVVAGARTDFLCRADLEAYPLLAHRVQSIKTVFNTSP